MKKLVNIYDIPEDKFRQAASQFLESKAENCIDGQYEAQIYCAEQKIRLLKKEIGNLRRENKDLKVCIKVLKSIN